MTDTAKTVLIHSVFIFVLCILSDEEDIVLTTIILVGIFGSTIITTKSVFCWIIEEIEKRRPK